MKKKKVLVLSALVLAAVLWMVPIGVEAACGPWEEMLATTTYCATPVCYTGNRSYIIEHSYSRMCSDGLWNIYRDYDYRKIPTGCCSYN